MEAKTMGLYIHCLMNSSKQPACYKEHVQLGSIIRQQPTIYLVTLQNSCLKRSCPNTGKQLVT